MEKPIVFRNKGQQLVGMLHVPDSAKGKLPAILMLHGFTGHKIETHRLFVRAARKLMANGFCVFRFDFRGSGDSEGNFEDMTVSGELSDAVTALELLKSFEHVDVNRIGAIGFSLGGGVAAMLAGRMADSISALALWAAVSEDPPDNFQYFRSLFENREDKSVDWVEHNGYLIGKNFFMELENLTPLRDVLRFNGPVLLVHGQEDKTVSPEHAKTYFRELKRNGNKVYLKIIEGAGHTFIKRSHENALIATTVEFFKSHL